jgi:hypothetical protein
MLFFAIHVRRGIVWTPPEWLKTTTLSQLYPLWLTYRWAANGNIDRLAGMLMSEEQKLAQRNLGVVSWHIEFNERLQRDFLDDVGRPLVEPDPDADKWTDSEIVVRRGSDLAGQGPRLKGDPGRSPHPPARRRHRHAALGGLASDAGEGRAAVG